MYCIELEIEGKGINIIIFLGNLKACWKEIFEKYSVLQMKLVADLLENHPFSFLPVMKEALVRTHHMFSRILNLLFVIVFIKKNCLFDVKQQ